MSDKVERGIDRLRVNPAIIDLRTKKIHRLTEEAYVGQFMSDEDKAAAANLIKDRTDWQRLPRLGDLFKDQPSDAPDWRELVVFVITHLQHPDGLMKLQDEYRQACKDRDQFKSERDMAHNLLAEEESLKVLKARAELDRCRQDLGNCSAYGEMRDAELKKTEAARPTLLALFDMHDSATWEQIAYQAECRKSDWDEMVSERRDLVQKSFVDTAILKAVGEALPCDDQDIEDVAAMVVRQRDDARKAGQRLYRYLKGALNSWLPVMLDELNDDEEEDNEMISGLASMLVECAPALEIEE
jgi:hypothetical protein